MTQNVTNFVKIISAVFLVFAVTMKFIIFNFILLWIYTDCSVNTILLFRLQ